MTDTSPPARPGADFIRAIAHALRSPLSVVDGALGELVGASAAEVEALVPMARRNLARLDALATRLEWIAELEQGSVHPDPQSLPIARIIERLLAEREGHGLHIELALADEEALADERLLARAIGIVLDNAMRFAQQRVEVGTERAGTRVAFWVEDDGPGMRPRGDAPFERYGSGASRGCAHELATGLSVARDYVRLMAGELTVTSLDGRATRCRIELPAPKSEPPAP